MIQGDITRLHFATDNCLMGINNEHNNIHNLGVENYYTDRDLAIISLIKILINKYVIDFTPYTKDVIKFDVPTQTWIVVTGQVININAIIPIDMMITQKLFNMLCNTNYCFNFTL